MFIFNKLTRNLAKSFMQSWILPLALTLTVLIGCRNTPNLSSRVVVFTASDGLHVRSSTAEFVLSSSGYLSANLLSSGSKLTLDDNRQGSGQHVRLGDRDISDFALDIAHPQVRQATGKLGKQGKHVEVHGKSASSALAEVLTLEVYDEFPGMAILSASYHNDGPTSVRIESVTLQEHRFNASLQDATVAANDMWSFFGSSLKWGKDEILPMPVKFSQENPFSVPMEVDGDAGAAGGGIPVVAFWTRNVGEAIGHLETVPLVLSIPVQTDDDRHVVASVSIPANSTLQPGASISTPRTFVAVYQGDYYQPLALWSKAVDREGLSQTSANEEDYAVSWCGWGYRSSVTPKQMLDTLPKLKELGIHWATLDDGWFNNYGDWQPRLQNFPGDSVQRLVKSFHDQGVKVQLWWLPLGVENGQAADGSHKYGISEVARQHPEWLILDKEGNPAKMARNLETLCPALPEVQAYTRQLTERFIRDWDFDGHKLDNIFATPRCYNPRHHHKSPDDSVNAMGQVYKIILQTTRALKPDSVTQSCPCGTPPASRGSATWIRR